jgi:peptidoglycan/xylan/chitin deacetylase (PgdA/CDA1 family)
VTMPPLPAKGSTDWYDPWAKAVHDAANEARTGRLTDAALRAASRTAYAATREAPRPVPTWTSTFQAGHGWTNPFSFGTLTDDATDFVIGSQSLRIADTAAQRTGLSLNLTGKALAARLKVDSLGASDSVVIYAADAGFANYYAWTITHGGDASPWFRPGEWVDVVLPVEDASVVGAPNRAALSVLRVRALSVGTFHVNAIGTAPVSPQWPTGATSITFDDGYTSVLDAARSYMTPRGLRGTLYVIPEAIGTPGFLTEAQLRELHDVHGWDIQAHGLTAYTDLTVEQMRAEWAATKRWLIERGLGSPDHLAYVGGQNNATVVATAREFFTTARSIAGRTTETWPPAMPHRLRALSSISSATGGNTAATVQTRLNRAAAGKQWLPLVFHRLVSGTPTNTNDCTFADFAAILDHIQASGIAVRTVAEVFTDSGRGGALGRTHVVVDPNGGGDFATLAEAFAAHPAGDVHIELTAGDHNLAATLTAAAVENVTISGQGRDATTLHCTAGFIDAQANADTTGACNQWEVYGLTARHVDGTNTHDGIKVDYPRRWMVRDCRFAGFGGSTIWYRGGLHSWIERNIVTANDSTRTNGHSGIRVDLSSAGIVPTTIITRSNYVDGGVQYGLYFNQTNVGCLFEGDIAEKCAVGFRFDRAGGVLVSPYTEANTVGVELHDSLIPVIGWLRDEPVYTWSAQAFADRRPMRIGRTFINPGKAIIYGNQTGPANNPDTAPSIRWGNGSPEGVVTGVRGSVWYRLDGGVSATEYVKESGTGNTGWVARGSAAADAARGNQPGSVIHTVQRELAGSSVALTAGTVYLTMFTPAVTATITKLAACSGTTAWSGNTLIRLGLYVINADGTATLVAATANDPALFGSASTVYSKALDTGGGLPASYTVQAGQRYAVGVVGVGGTVGHLRGAVPLLALALRAPLLAGTAGTGATDLPTGPVNVTAYNFVAWAELAA